VKFFIIHKLKFYTHQRLSLVFNNRQNYKKKFSFYFSNAKTNEAKPNEFNKATRVEAEWSKTFTLTDIACSLFVCELNRLRKWSKISQTMFGLRWASVSKFRRWVNNCWYRLCCFSFELNRNSHRHWTGKWLKNEKHVSTTTLENYNLTKVTVF